MASSSNKNPVEEVNAIRLFVEKHQKLPKHWDPELLVAVLARKRLSKQYDVSNHPVLKNLGNILKSLESVKVDNANKAPLLSTTRFESEPSLSFVSAVPSRSVAVLHLGDLQGSKCL